MKEKLWHKINGPRVILRTKSMPIWHMLTRAKTPSAVEMDYTVSEKLKSLMITNCVYTLLMQFNASRHFGSFIKMKQ